MGAQTVKIKLESDMTEVIEGVDLLMNHVEGLGEVVDKLRENGINIELSIDVNHEKFFQKAVKVKN